MASRPPTPLSHPHTPTPPHRKPSCPHAHCKRFTDAPFATSANHAITTAVPYTYDDINGNAGPRRHAILTHTSLHPAAAPRRLGTHHTHGFALVQSPTHMTISTATAMVTQDLDDVPSLPMLP